MTRTGICWAALGLGALLLTGCGRESADWKSATAADTSEAYQQFLQQHPSSTNAAQAQTRIKELADDRDWQAATAADSRAAYEQFVAQHADSKWAQEARIRIENFAQSGAAAAPLAPTSNPAAAAPVAVAPSAPKPPAVAASSPSRPVPSNKPAVAAPVRSAGGASADHFVQLGAFRSKQSAESQWKRLSAKYPTQLQSLKPRYVAGKSKQGQIYRLQVGVSSASSAKGLCATLKKHAQACVPVTA